MLDLIFAASYSLFCSSPSYTHHIPLTSPHYPSHVHIAYENNLERSFVWYTPWFIPPLQVILARTFVHCPTLALFFLDGLRGWVEFELYDCLLSWGHTAFVGHC